MSLTPETALERAKALREKAREHKRMERYNRRQSRKLMEQLSQFQKECNELGIRLHIHQTKPQEAKSSDKDRRSRSE